MPPRASTLARYERFAREYILDHNASRAAVAAGYSKKNPDVEGSRLLAKPLVQELIACFAKKTAAKLEITAERVLNEIAKLAFMDPRKFFLADGSPIPIQDLDDDTAAALAGMDVFEEYEGQGEDRKFVGYTKKFKLTDKGQNLERLGRYLKLFTDKVEASGPNGGPIKVEVDELTARAAEILRKRDTDAGV